MTLRSENSMQSFLDLKATSSEVIENLNEFQFLNTDSCEFIPT